MTDVFNNDNQQDTIPTMNDLVGEGKKYKSAEELVKAYAHSQKHIKTLETERAEDKAKIAAQMTLDEVVNQIATRTSGNQSQDRPTNSDPNDDAKLEEKLNAILTKRQLQDSAISNTQLVSNKLVEMFGDKATEQLRAKANELGMTFDQMRSMAANTPRAVLAYFNPTQTRQVQPQVTIQSKQPVGNNTTQALEINGHKTMAYYRKMRETEGAKKYLLPDVQLQMSRDAQALGDQFY